MRGGGGVEEGTRGGCIWRGSHPRTGGGVGRPASAFWLGGGGGSLCFSMPGAGPRVGVIGHAGPASGRGMGGGGAPCRQEAKKAARDATGRRRQAAPAAAREVLPVVAHIDPAGAHAGRGSHKRGEAWSLPEGAARGRSLPHPPHSHAPPLLCTPLLSLSSPCAPHSPRAQPPEIPHAPRPHSVADGVGWNDKATIDSSHSPPPWQRRVAHVAQCLHGVPSGATEGLSARDEGAASNAKGRVLCHCASHLDRYEA